MRLDGDRVRRARDRIGYTLKLVADESGLARDTVMRAEHSDEIRPSSARKLAGALGVEVADLMREEKE